MQENLKNEIDVNELIVNIFIFFRKKFFILFGFLVVGIIIGVAKHYTGKPEYETNMTAISIVGSRHTNFTSEMAVNIINSLQKLIDTENTKELAAKCNISVETAKKINSIKTYFLYPVKGTEDEEDGIPTNFFSINASISDNTIIDSLQIGIENCITQNSFVISSLSKAKQRYEKSIKHIDNEIKKLDSIQKAFLKNSGNINNYLAVKGHSFIAENIEFFKLKVSYQISLDELSPFTVITDFTYPMDNKKSIVKSVLIYGIFFTVLGFIFIFIFGYNKKAKLKMKTESE